MNKIICFSPNTQIYLDDYRTKSICDIGPKDNVFSFNEKCNKVESSRVICKVSDIHEEYMKIKFRESGLVSTRDHPIWVLDKGWCSFDNESSYRNYGIAVKNLKEGDKCLRINEKGSFTYSQIDEIKMVRCSMEMFTISSERNNSFFANGYLVHDENLFGLIRAKKIGNSEVHFA
ncbi:MAG: Hint domain-containing protein [Reichenbachiella sp.]|uniref:Hint domain-containing protein n=1 Tax=Reichenbachiella sp. TaxID=2184521 RepID=UPI003265478B